METYGVLRWVMNSVIRKKGSTGFSSSSSATSMVNNKCGDDYFYTTGDYQKNKKKEKVMKTTTSFQMPLHYPRYKKADYEKMEEWKLDILFTQYGLNFKGTLDEKRSFAMGAFLWPDQL